MSRTHLERDGETADDSDNKNTGEIENGVRQRRDEAVAHRKWLRSLPVHERINQQRQQNALRKWRQINREWEVFKTRAARHLKKAPQELVISRAAAYREQREMYDALQKARPLRDKVGEDLWLVSLRDEGTRFVPVGNIFSGLYCPIRETTKLGPSIRRPLDCCYDDSDNCDHEVSRSLSKLEKRSLDLLAQKKWRLRKQLKVLRPYEVQSSGNSRLAVETLDLFTWASGPGEDGDDDESVQLFAHNEEQEASRRRKTRSHASASSSTMKNLNASDGNTFEGPSLRIINAADDDKDIDANITTDNNDSFESCVQPLRLSFFTPVGEQDQQIVTIMNDGDTIVHYQWWRCRLEDVEADMTSHLRGRRSRREAQELKQLATILVSKNGGTLLPGDTQQFVFTFQSSKAGMYHAKWIFDANPQPRVRFGSKSIDPDTKSSPTKVPVEVRLSCVAVDNFSPQRQRAMQLTRIQQQEGRYLVASLVNELVNSVRLPEPVVFDDVMLLNDANKFYEQNGPKEFCDVYFSPNLMRDCHALYERAKGILNTLAPILQAPLVDENRAKGETAVGVANVNEETYQPSPTQNGSAGTNDIISKLEENTVQSARLLTPPVQEWNCRLESLRELCVMADQAQRQHLGRMMQLLEEEFAKLEDEDDDGQDEVDDEAENERDEEAQEEDDEEDEEGEGGKRNDNANGDTIKILPFKVRWSDMSTRRQALRVKMNAYQPEFQQTFEKLRYAAYTAPYQSTRLHQRQYERIASLCSEVPIVCDIAEMLNPGKDRSTYAAKVEGVGKLLMHAIDEAIGGDQEHQILLEQEQRRAQKMWLEDKASFLTIKLDRPPLIPLSSVNLEVTASNKQAQEQMLDQSGVLLMQVDLDLASWFSLVQAEAKESGVVGNEMLELAWQFSPQLAQQESFVPTKILEAADAVKKVIDVLASSSLHTVVLVSELSRPPLTRHMCNLLRRAAQAVVEANHRMESQKTETGITPPKSEESGEATRAAMKDILERLLFQLSLRDVAHILQRAVGQSVTFCATVGEMQSQCRNNVVMPPTGSPYDSQNENLDGQSEVAEVIQKAKVAPRILLLEHVEAAGIDLVTSAAQKQEAAVSKPATPTLPVAQERVAGGQKRAVRSAPKGKEEAPAVLVSPTSKVTSSLPVRNLSKHECAGEDPKEQSIVALRNEFMRVARICVMDCLPSQAYENVFAFTALPDTTLPRVQLCAGPTLWQELETWHQTLQPVGPKKQLCALTAVVGGKSLEAKLRLIDGLLECVQEIYFVGEVAMSLYRVLHTKLMSKSATRDDVGLNTKEEIEKFIGKARVEIVSETSSKNESNKICQGKQTGTTCSMSSWDLLVPAVEKLQQKANRKCVRLLLPVDWIVGDATIEEQEKSHGDADNIDDEEEEGEEVDESWNVLKTSGMKSARRKPVEEPDYIDVFEQKRQYAYEGERAHVVLSLAPTKDVKVLDVGWQSFEDITTLCLADARVLDGKPSILATSCSESDGEDDEFSDNDAALPKPSSAKFVYDWTFRALDVGPIAMQALAKLLQRDVEWESQNVPSSVSKALIVNGVCGAVEFHEFCTATKQLLQIFQSKNLHNVFIAGNETAFWLRQLQSQLPTCSSMDSNKGVEAKSLQATFQNSNEFVSSRAPTRKVVGDRVMRNARVLKRLIAIKPHPTLVNLASREYM